MDDATLAAIAARADAASPGPWHWERCLDSTPEDPTYYELSYQYQTIGGLRGAAVIGMQVYADGDVWAKYLDVEPADRDFIAHAREDVPALVAEVRRLRALLAERAEPPDGR